MKAKLGELRDRLDTAREGLRINLDPERRKAALAEVLAPFKKGGPYAFVPALEGRIPAEKNWLAQENDRASRALYHVERAVMDIAHVVDAMKARAMRTMYNDDALLTRRIQ